MANRRFRARWILFALLAGLGLLYPHIDRSDSQFEGVLLEVGAGLLLFAALFLYERGLGCSLCTFHLWWFTRCG